MTMPANNNERSTRLVADRRGRQPIFDLPAAAKTLPLVRRTARDIVEAAAELATLRLRQEKSSQQPKAQWLDRKARYQLEERVREIQAHIKDLCRELNEVGCTLIDARRGVVGYPSLVNGALAFLVYVYGDGEIAHWCYRDEYRLRDLPQTWKDEAFCLDEGITV